MQKQYLRNRSVFQQTKALLLKNIILKWRMSMQSFQEWFSALALLLAITAALFSKMYMVPHEITSAFLGQLDYPAFNITDVKIVYTPGTKIAREIMGKIETVSVLKGIKTELVQDEETMEAALKENSHVIGVVFQDDFSYRLRFLFDGVNSPNEAIGEIDHCYRSNYSDPNCKNPKYWYNGFISLQTSIDSALIELITNHSIWDEMKSLGGVRMRSSLITPDEIFEQSMFLLLLSMYFSPFMYFLSQNVSREKRELKELMNMMGLRDIAFWLSWDLLYAVIIMIMSCVLTSIANVVYLTTSSFPALFLLIFLYGISLITFCFMISSLLKKPKLVSFVSFFLTLTFGTASIASRMSLIPAPLEWILNLFCPYAFGIGLSKIFCFQKYGKDYHLVNIVDESYSYVFLLFDMALYMLLAIYFDKILPNKYGVPLSPLFFLKKTYWCKSKSRFNGDAPTNELRHGNIFSDNTEALPPEFDGKEAIRLNHIKKTYKTKSMKTEGLRGLSLTIYEGQITAVLGHSGAGKTTLLNILNGLSKPTNGSANIFKYNVMEREDMEQIRKISAFCPQFNIQFEALTVKENLKTFAGIKGIPSSDIENEIMKAFRETAPSMIFNYSISVGRFIGEESVPKVRKLLTLLDMNAIQDTQANRLSGGQKRKLSLGITFLGDPQVLLLDEPTAGLDPYSRHQVWSLLNERKANHVTLFTTKFMDEADILADRKAFISNGRLKCVGSSLYLKRKWGIGYYLRMHVSGFCDSDRTTSLVKRYIPAAKLSGQRENELSYILPLESVDKFPDLFCALDNQTDLGLLNYGVTITSLEDVFFKLEGDDDEDYGILHREPVEGDRRGEMEQDLLLLSDTGKATVHSTDLWRQQVYAIARMHFLNLKRETKIWVSLLLLLGIILAPFIIQLTTLGLWKNLHNVELHPRHYFEPGKTSFKGQSGLLILNDTGTSIDKFIHAVKSQNIQMEIITGKNISDQLVHSGAIEVALVNQKYKFTLMCHMEIINCFPSLVNIISNAFLQMLNSTAHIRIWSHVFFEVADGEIIYYFSEIYIIMVVVILLPAFPPHFAMSSVRDYKIKALSQLRVSGLFPSAYWCGLALIDVPLHWILLFLMFGPYFYSVSLPGSHITTCTLCMVSFLIGYGISIILFLYVIAFIFRKQWHTSTFWSVISVLVMLLIIFISSFLYHPLHFPYLRYLLTILLPPYPAMINFSRGPLDYEAEFYSYVVTSCLMTFCHSIILVFLLRCLEKKYGRPLMRRDPFFRISPHRGTSHQNPEEPSEDDDRDVQEERARAQSAMLSADQTEELVIIVCNLCKEYKTKKACSCSKDKEKKKVATKNVSFCVKRGEVWGLLGPNGAGKSTTMNMITGDTELTAGQVLIKGAAATVVEDQTAGFLGYCPQEDTLWPNLTMKEHMEIYAAVKGIRKDAAAVAIDRVAQALELQDHLKKSAKTLSAGLLRKLCFALSMLGKPVMMLLDEPTIGMDPKGKRQVWKAIRALLMDKNQGAILTTHHMEEAEAMCDRVAIMVSGQLRCLGSIQYLKSKFGKNYLLQIKVKGIEQGDCLNAEILKLFPRAARQERISTLLVYKIPMEDALPLSKAFSMLEEAKRKFSFEEYSFSLNTLEQVFLELCKDQERDYFDTNLDATFEWKRLQHDDS